MFYFHAELWAETLILLKDIKSRHHDIALMSMYLTDTFCSFTRNFTFKSCQSRAVLLGIHSHLGIQLLFLLTRDNLSCYAHGVPNDWRFLHVVLLTLMTLSFHHLSPLFSCSFAGWCNHPQHHAVHGRASEAIREARGTDPENQRDVIDAQARPDERGPTGSFNGQVEQRAARKRETGTIHDETKRSQNMTEVCWCHTAL